MKLILAWIYWGLLYLSGKPSRDAVLLALRRHPYWAHGHRWLAYFELNHSNRELAYSSALALQRLSGGVESEILLARAMLLARDAGAAKVILNSVEKAKLSGRLLVQFLEATAATKLFEGELSAAVALALEIPETDRSPEIVALLTHAKGPNGRTREDRN